ncbi:ABC transporter permease [Glaciibacter psychrotolerans]|uniref:Putative ABC transport system permease protein n=1 Tax=Glaciibacter psychrotolerans TaxID=670054 RepID=A0A7Z0J595_9MICO|nr:ABC transporter permease [Leifsonia psychrotolerans]NYJ18683.1 putative ABC transport system permease protein [Leifsonia psychrotolerans]
MKSIDIIKAAVANTFRSRLRTTLTVIAIVIGAFTLTITSAIGTGVSNYINAQVASIGSTDVFTISPAVDTTPSVDAGPKKYEPDAAKATGGFGGPGRSTAVLTQKDIDTIGTVSGIMSVEPLLIVSPDYIQYGNNGKFVLTVSPSGTITKADLVTGKQLDNNSNDNQILLPTPYLASLGLGTAKDAVGATVTIGVTSYEGVQSTVEATVAGVQNETLLGSSAALNQHLTTAISEVQREGTPASVVRGYAVATAQFDANLSTAQVKALQATLKDKGYSALTVADQLGSFESVINGIIGVLNAFAVIALIAAGFGIINTLLMSVQERTREIGLMKAMGMSGGKVYALFSMEAIFIGFLGSAIGALLAIGVGTVISNALADTVLSGLPGLQVMQFAPASIAVIIVVVMLIAFLAGTLPARRAARQNPIDALRYE